MYQEIKIMHFETIKVIFYIKKYLKITQYC